MILFINYDITSLFLMEVNFYKLKSKQMEFLQKWN